MRHGDAAALRAGADEDRHLTVDGRRASEATAARLTGAWRPTQIYTSPLVRAVQTAERVASVLEHEGEIVVVPALVPGGSAAHAFVALSAHGAQDVVLFVSHEPTVRGLMGHLVGGAVPGFSTAEARGVTIGVAGATHEVTFLAR
ncbi:MAG: histidine phosphatase family protein [Sandaracinaceae bacterium]